MRTPVLLCLFFSLGYFHDLTSKHERGQVRRTSFWFEDESSLVKMTYLMDGEEQSGTEELSETRTSSGSGLFVDTTVKVEGSTRTVFDREYEELELHDTHAAAAIGWEGLGTASVSESKLEGAVVRFSKESEGFVATFPKGEKGDKDLLAGLVAEFPWSDYLPEESVDEDDEWELEPEVLFRTFALGGNLALLSDKVHGNPEGFFRSPDDDADVDYGGKITATLVGLSEVDDRIQADISLDVEVTKLEDETAAAQARMANRRDDIPGDLLRPYIDSKVVETSYEGEGTLIWDVEGGYLISLDLELESESTETVRVPLGIGDRVLETEQTVVFAGHRLVSVEVEVESH